MRFIDEAKIKISGGHGGPGCVSFRRETFIPRGGPDGGDGGTGGSVYFVASSQLGSLQDFRFRRSYIAENGHHGSGANKAGKDGKDITIRVPVGTLIKDQHTLEVLMDFTKDGQTWTACQGGRGGKGNSHFVTSTHQAPRFAQPGEEGTHREIVMELKLLADVGIIGQPNAGKSTLISRMSAARPKIADYPFTTLTPHLGVVSAGDHNTFVMADIPGLVEGAHKGIGLGHKFLKHIERTDLLIHLIDATLILLYSEGYDFEAVNIDGLVETYRTIRGELSLFSKKLEQKPEIVVLNKIDALPWSPEQLEIIRQRIQVEINRGRSTPSLSAKEPLVVSAVSGEGIHELISEVYSQVQILKGTSRTEQEQDQEQPQDSSLATENPELERRDSRECILPDDPRLNTRGPKLNLRARKKLSTPATSQAHPENAAEITRKSS